MTTNNEDLTNRVNELERRHMDRRARCLEECPAHIDIKGKVQSVLSRFNLLIWVIGGIGAILALLYLEMKDVKATVTTHEIKQSGDVASMQQVVAALATDHTRMNEELRQLDDRLERTRSRFLDSRTGAGTR